MAFEDQTKKWAGALGQEIVAIKPRIDSLEAAIPVRVAAQAATDDRVGRLEQVIPMLRRETGAVDEKYHSLVASLEAAIAAAREEAASAVRTTAAKEVQDIMRVEEHLEVLRHQEEATKRILAANIEQVSQKLNGVEQFVQTRAKASDVQALELRVNETIERGLKAVNEEVSRKENISTVKAVSDRLTTLTMDVNANQVKSNSEDEALGKKISEVDQAFQKLARQVDADRDRTNEGLVSLEKNLNTKALKSDVEVIPPRIAAIEVQLPPLLPEIATKASSEEVRSLAGRIMGLERVYPTKADASELPKLHLSIADYQAKHAAVVARAQEHDNNMERFHGVAHEHYTRIEVVEQRERDLHALVASKAEAEHVFTKDACTMLLGDYYRREEIDAIMTRVWWRVGDTAKTPRGALPPGRAP